MGSQIFIFHISFFIAKIPCTKQTSSQLYFEYSISLFSTYQALPQHKLLFFKVTHIVCLAIASCIQFDGIGQESPHSAFCIALVSFQLHCLLTTIASIFLLYSFAIFGCIVIVLSYSLLFLHYLIHIQFWPSTLSRTLLNFALMQSSQSLFCNESHFGFTRHLRQELGEKYHWQCDNSKLQQFRQNFIYRE